MNQNIEIKLSSDELNFTAHIDMTMAGKIIGYVAYTNDIIRKNGKGPADPQSLE